MSKMKIFIIRIIFINAYINSINLICLIHTTRKNLRSSRLILRVAPGLAML